MMCCLECCLVLVRLFTCNVCVEFWSISRHTKLDDGQDYLIGVSGAGLHDTKHLCVIVIDTALDRLEAVVGNAIHSCLMI